MSPCSVCSLKGRCPGSCAFLWVRGGERQNCTLQKGLRRGLVTQLRVCSDWKADGSEWSIFSSSHTGSLRSPANCSWIVNWCSHLNTGDGEPDPRGGCGSSQPLSWVPVLLWCCGVGSWRGYVISMWMPWISWGFGVALKVCVQAAEANLQSCWTPDRSDWWCWSIPGLSGLPLPAWGWATRKETGSRHFPSGITDSRDPMQTLQLFPSFSFFLIVRCEIAIGGTTYCYSVIWESLWTCFSWALVSQM